MKSHYKGYHRFYVTLRFRITFTGLENIHQNANFMTDFLKQITNKRLQRPEWK